MNSAWRWYRSIQCLALKVVVLMVAVGLFQGCEDSTGPFPPPNQPQLNKNVEKAARSGWQTVSALNTNGRLFQTVQGMSAVMTEEPGTMTNLRQIERQQHRFRQVVQEAVKARQFQKTMAETLVWKVTWQDSLSGTAGVKALLYDPETGIGRVYVVISQFPPQVNLTYDSTDARIHLGASLSDSTDDRLLSIDHLSLFRADFAVQKVASHVEATDWGSNNQVTGAILSNVVDYGPQGELVRLSQNAEFNPDDSGSLSERFDYRDNTFRESQINFYANHTGDFNEVWRNGITVDGTFDLLEPDNHAAITRTLHFPNHPEVDRIEEEAEYTLDPTDSSSAGTVVKRIIFHNGTLDTTRIEAEHFLNTDGHWVDHLVVNTSSEGETELMVTHFDSYQEFEGNQTTPEGLFLVFHGTEYASGNGELFLDLYASRAAYNQGEPPLLSLHIIYNGDGSGSGEITLDGKTYQVSFQPDGNIAVKDPSGTEFTLTGL